MICVVSEFGVEEPLVTAMRFLFFTISSFRERTLSIRQVSGMPALLRQHRNEREQDGYRQQGGQGTEKTGLSCVHGDTSI